MYGDNCNFDGYTNSIYTISIGAISSKNEHPPYSEPCSAQIAVTYSSGSAKQITTTDVSIGNLQESVCTSNHGGTSAAAPIAAGIFALVLSARPDLTWRDLQRLAIESAVPVATDDNDWVKTVNGRMFNHKFGYGKLDTEILIKNAKTFKLLNKQTSFETEVVKVNKEIQGNVPVTSSVYIKSEDVKKFKHLEHVNVKVNLTHQRRGDVKIDLISPHGLVSNVATSRRKDASESGLENWLFMSVKHWDEDPVGEWKLRAQNELSTSTKGMLVDWTLILWGEELDEEELNKPSNNENKPDTSKEDDKSEDHKEEEENKTKEGEGEGENKNPEEEDDKKTEEGNDDKKTEEGNDDKKENEKTEEPDTESSTQTKENSTTTKKEEQSTIITSNSEEKSTIKSGVKETKTITEVKPTNTNEDSSNNDSTHGPMETPTDISTPGNNGGIDYERTHEAIVAAEFSIGIVAAAGLGFIFWRYTRKRNFRDDIEFQILDQEKQLMAEEEDDDDDYDDEETEMQNKVIFENHFLDDDEENDNVDALELLDELSSQASV